MSKHLFHCARDKPALYHDFRTVSPKILRQRRYVLGQRPEKSCDSVDWFSDSVPKNLTTASIGFRTASRKILRQRRMAFGQRPENSFDSVDWFSDSVPKLLATASIGFRTVFP